MVPILATVIRGFLGALLLEFPLSFLGGTGGLGGDGTVLTRRLGGGLGGATDDLHLLDRGLRIAGDFAGIDLDRTAHSVFLAIGPGLILIRWPAARVRAGGGFVGVFVLTDFAIATLEFFDLLLFFFGEGFVSRLVTI